jgi:hypothetical protein
MQGKAMKTKLNIEVNVARSDADRDAALQVLREVYVEDKQWLMDADEIFPQTDLAHKGITWLIVSVDKQPAGVLRILYELPVELYTQYDFKLLDANLDIEAFLSENKIAEIGRFAVLRRYRRRISVVMALINMAAAETMNRGFSHFVTDVFEGEINSPLKFHINVIGFKPIATHDVGEINCPNRRVTLILNLNETYRRLKKVNSRLYRNFRQSLDPAVAQQLP